MIVSSTTGYRLLYHQKIIPFTLSSYQTIRIQVERRMKEKDNLTNKTKTKEDSN